MDSPWHGSAASSAHSIEDNHASFALPRTKRSRKTISMDDGLLGQYNGHGQTAFRPRVSLRYHATAQPKPSPLLHDFLCQTDLVDSNTTPLRQHNVSRRELGEVDTPRSEGFALAARPSPTSMWDMGQLEPMRERAGGSDNSFSPTKLPLPSSSELSATGSLDKAIPNLRLHSSSLPRRQHGGQVEHDEIYTESLSYESTTDSQTFSRDSEPPFMNGFLTRNDAHSFPPRPPLARRYSSPRAKYQAVSNIHSWMTSFIYGTGSRDTFNGRTGEAGQIATRSGSEGESLNESDAFANRVEDLWRQLVSQRKHVGELRNSVAERRSRLRSLRPRMFEADNTFMAMVRPLIIQNHASQKRHSVEQFETQLAELQKLRDEHQDLELSCDEAEQAVSWEEARLSHLEIKFYSLLGKVDDEDDDLDNSVHDQEESVPFELRGICPDKGGLEHPTYTRLERAVALLRIGKEELDELLRVKEQCDEMKERSLRLGLKVSRQVVEFLADFDPTYDELQQRIAETEDDVRRYQQLCEDKGVMPEFPTDDVWSTLYPNSPLEGINLGDEATILAEHDSLAHPVFTVLLSQPNNLLEDQPLIPKAALAKAEQLPGDDPEKKNKIGAVKKEIAIERLLTGPDEMPRAMFINRWLLLKLRLSPLDVALLFSIVLSYLGVRNIVRWQHDVLRLWRRDGVEELMERHLAYAKQSLYFSKTATRQRSRAASEVPTPEKPDQQLRRVSSTGAVLESVSNP